MPPWLTDHLRSRVLVYALIIAAGVAFALLIGPPWTGPVFIAAWIVADVVWTRSRASRRSP